MLASLEKIWKIESSSPSTLCRVSTGSRRCCFSDRIPLHPLVREYFGTGFGVNEARLGTNACRSEARPRWNFGSIYDSRGIV
jgi:hypothetical protein